MMSLRLIHAFKYFLGREGRRVCLLLTVLLAVEMFTPSCTQVQEGPIKAFSLREANHRLEQGMTSNKELNTLGGITRFAGMVFDRDTSDLILVGKVLKDQPEVTLDDLAVALRCRLQRDQYPLVSIDIVESTGKTGMQEVRFQGGIENTTFGKDFFESDIILKRYSLDLMKAVSDVRSYLKLYEEAIRKRMANEGHSVDKVNWLSPEESEKLVQEFIDKTAKESEAVQSRFWFYPLDEYSYVVEKDDVYVIEELQLGVRAEIVFHSGYDSSGKKISETKDEIGEQFASDFTKYYRKVCSEYPSLKRLKVLFDIVAISDGIANLGKDRPALDYLLNKHPIQRVDTPKTYPLLNRVGMFNGKNNTSTLVQLSGGVELKTILLALKDGDPSALKKAVLLSRPNERSLSWSLPLDEWKMPNDEPSSLQQRQSKTIIPRTAKEENKLGMSLTRQGYVFGGLPKGTSRPELKFNGFPFPAPIKPLLVPPPAKITMKKLRGVDIGIGVKEESFKKDTSGELKKLRDDVLKSKPDKDSLFYDVDKKK